MNESQNRIFANSTAKITASLKIFHQNDSFNNLLVKNGKNIYSFILLFFNRKNRKSVLFPIPCLLYVLITKQWCNQLFSSSGEIFQIIILPFVYNKTECLTGENQEVSASRFLKVVCFTTKHFYYSSKTGKFITLQIRAHFFQFCKKGIEAHPPHPGNFCS